MGKKTSREFSGLSFLWRFLFALLLILATYNPSGYSMTDWVRNAMAESNLGPEHFFLSTLLLIGWSSSSSPRSSP